MTRALLPALALLATLHFVDRIVAGATDPHVWPSHYSGEAE